MSRTPKNFSCGDDSLGSGSLDGRSSSPTRTDELSDIQQQNTSEQTIILHSRNSSDSSGSDESSVYSDAVEFIVETTEDEKSSPTKQSAPSMSRLMTNLQACGQNQNRFSETPLMSNIGQSKHCVSTASLVSIQSSTTNEDDELHMNDDEVDRIFDDTPSTVTMRENNDRYRCFLEDSGVSLNDSSLPSSCEKKLHADEKPATAEPKKSKPDNFNIVAYEVSRCEFRTLKSQQTSGAVNKLKSATANRTKFAAMVKPSTPHIRLLSGNIKPSSRLAKHYVGRAYSSQQLDHDDESLVKTSFSLDDIAEDPRESSYEHETISTKIEPTPEQSSLSHSLQILKTISLQIEDHQSKENRDARQRPSVADDVSPDARVGQTESAAAETSDNGTVCGGPKKHVSIKANRETDDEDGKPATAVVSNVPIVKSVELKKPYAERLQLRTDVDPALITTQAQLSDRCYGPYYRGVVVRKLDRGKRIPAHVDPWETIFESIRSVSTRENLRKIRD